MIGHSLGPLNALYKSGRGFPYVKGRESRIFASRSAGLFEPEEPPPP
jgi:hypothetical protein